ncbi:hypothetical protein FAI41_06930 [Acetobacteraceae bacterium]|nr:hypothetical protein FAI41_06930 [Acetobacteraceae bacterium]
MRTLALLYRFPLIIFTLSLTSCNSYFANGLTKTYFTAKVSDGVFKYNSACVRDENWRIANAPYGTCRMFLNKGLPFSQYQALRLEEISDKQISLWIGADYKPDFMSKAIHSEIETPLELDNWIETLGIPTNAFDKAKMKSLKKGEVEDEEEAAQNAKEVAMELEALVTLRNAVRKGVPASMMQRINEAYPREWTNLEATLQIADKMHHGMSLKMAAMEFFGEPPAS